MGKIKITAIKEGSADIILILNKKSVIEECTDEVRAKSRWFQRKNELKEQGRLITHEIDAKPVECRKIKRGRILHRPMRFEEEKD